MQAHWLKGLEIMPPVVVSYLIDQYEVEGHFPAYTSDGSMTMQEVIMYDD